VRLLLLRLEERVDGSILYVCLLVFQHAPVLVLLLAALQEEKA